MPRLFAFFLVLVAASPSALAQQTIYEDARVPFRREMYGGALLHGDGWGLHFHHAKYRTATDRRLLSIEVVGMKHPKEVKSFNPYYEDSRGYFYGKLNALTILRPTYGRKLQLTDKIRRSGVEINWVWGIGPSIGLLKPVYLEIGKPDAIPYDTYVIERYDPDAHNVQNIYGRASWLNGIGEIRPYFGGFGRMALNFEYSGRTTGIKAIETGVALDAYPVEVPIMAELEGVSNKQFFFQFYIAVQFGKRLLQ
ncbi:MAG: hypothetical protein IPM12_08535 [Flavobacteriales bacterium]|nr:hypothetical protein [Flavobacteriales bacterium]